MAVRSVNSEERDEIVFTVYTFKRREFAKHIADLTNADDSSAADLCKERIKQKAQIQYLAKYLHEINTKTIIEERLYCDREMLTDQWAYFPDGVSGSECDCSRVHFFEKDFVQNGREVKGKISQTQLNDFLRLRNATDESGYLGFIVLFLYGDRVIGNTCLKTYPIGNNVKPVQINGTGGLEHEKVSRRIPATREYEVNLAGHALSIDSLGFREQDKVTSACATCALWSTFQKTSFEFEHRALSPGEITARALNIQRRGSIFPEKKGLTTNNMDEAVRSIRTIRAYIYNSNRDFEEQIDNEERWMQVQSTLEFMLPILDSGIPVVLVMRASKNYTASKNYAIEKVHAICVVGYNYADEDTSTEDAPIDASLKSSKVLSLIAHDDNIGPFVQYDIEDSGYIRAPRKFSTAQPDKWHIQAAIGTLPASIKTYSYLEKNVIMEHLGVIIGLLSRAKDKKSPTWFARIWKSNEYKQRILDFASSGRCHTLKADVRGDDDIKINNDNEEAIPKIKQIINKLLSRNLPEYVLVISAREKFSHDLVFSLAGPWKRNKVIQIVPFDAEFYELIHKSLQKLRKYESEPNIGSVVRCVLKDFELSASTKSKRKA